MDDASRGGGNGAASSTQGAVAAAWSTAFGTEVGLHDDFFETGGDSLKAAQIAGQIREALGADLGLSFFFENPTVAEAAAAIDAMTGSPPA
ncbi:MAG TPA: acyl carrier protein [Actinomycetota bacterium]|nr:acyl carrier protein [Actinomycetota bacterium]